MARSTRTRVAVVATFVAAALVVTACGSGGGAASSSTSTAAASTTASSTPPESSISATTTSAADGSGSASSGADSSTSAALEAAASATASSEDVSKLPADIKSKGLLTVATTDGNAPWVFFEKSGSVPSGVDADLINEAAKRLRLTVKWQNVQFTAGIPGVQGGRYDFYLSAMADSKEREKVVNFIGYSKEGSGIIVPKGNTKHITTMKSLCGLKVSIVTGSIFPDVVKKLNETDCAGNDVQLSETADQTAPYLAVASGQADASMNTYGVSNYAFNTATGGIQSKLELSPVPLFAPAIQGIAFSKDKDALMKSVGGALQEMVKDGSYQKIMDKWKVGAGALTDIVFNAPLF